MSEEQFNELSAGKREYRTPERLREDIRVTWTRQRVGAESSSLFRCTAKRKASAF